MGKVMKTVRTQVEVLTCDRCQKPRQESAKPYVATLGGETITPAEYNVCKKCAVVLKNALTMVQRARKEKPAPVPAAAGAPGEL